MQLVEVTTTRHQKEFHKLPFSIYKNDSNWIPHLKQDIEKVFDPSKNKLFKGGQAIRWILYDDSSTAIGRIAAFINDKLAYTFDQPTGGVGFFECIDDEEASSLLLDQAKNWLESKGMEAMDGPINFGDKNQYWGLLVENFKDMGSYGMNYNPPYYQRLFEAYGFQTYYEQYVYSRSVNEPIQDVFVKKSERVMQNFNVQIRDAKGRSVKQIAHDFRTVYNAAWGGHDNFKEMSEAASLKVANALKPVMDKRVIIFAYHKERAIGFYISIPELNEIFRYVNGNLNWLGKLKFLYHKWKGTPRTLVGIVFGVAKDWQGKGIEGAMITWFSAHIAPKNLYDSTILTWIGDFNPKMIKVAKNLGTELHRRFITYRYLFDRTKEFKRCPIIE